MENVIHIDLSRCPSLIDKRFVRIKPDHCKYPVVGLQWELFDFIDFTLSIQQRSIVGAHLQLLELDIQRDTSIYFTIQKPKKILFFLFHGHIRFYNLQTKLLSEADGPCFFLNYNPMYEVELKLTKGSLNFLAITLDQDWPISKKEDFPAFSSLIEMWIIRSNNFIALNQAPITQSVEHILTKIRLLAVHSLQDNILILKLISDCLSIYHTLLKTFSDYKHSEMIVKGKILEEYLSNHFNDNHACQSAQIMVKLGWSEWTLRTIAHKTLQTTIFKYITRLRMTFAKEQLLYSTTLIKDIALQLGYSGSEAFIRVFKKEIGTNPKSYRELCKSNLQVTELEFKKID